MSEELKLGLVYLPSGLLILLIGLIVFLSQTKSKANLWFFLLMISIADWFLVRFLSGLDETMSTIVVDRLTISASVLIPLCFFFFAKYFITDSKVHPLIYVAIFFPTAFYVIAPPITDWFIVSLDSNPARDYILVDIGKLYFSNTLYIASIVLLSLVIIQKKQNSTTAAKTQAKIVYLAVGLTLLINVVEDYYFITFERNYTTLFHPFVTSSSFLIFGILVAYGILKNGLFDIKLAIVRTFGYFASFVLVAVCYGIILQLFTRIALDSAASSTQIIVGTIMVVAAVITFPMIKSFFDRWTNRLFLRSNYDSGEVLSRLNDIYITKTSLDEVLVESLQLISKTLSPTHAMILAVDGDTVTGAAGKLTSKAVAINGFGAYLRQMTWPSNNLLLQKDAANSNITRKLLQEINISLALRLVLKDSTVGYVLLGDKQSGDKYGKQDAQLLSVAAKNLSLSIRNTMQYAYIKEFNKTLKQEVASATSKLRASNRSLNKMSKAKDEMISMVSHQLIPQLVATKGFLELIEKSPKSRGELTELSNLTVSRMMHLANDLLNSSKLQSGELVLHKQSVNLGELVADEVKNVASVANKKSVNVRVHAENPADVFVDATMIKEAIFNLLENAASYSKAGNNVDVSVENNVLVIKDYGIGIPRKDQSKLFQKFYRASNAKTAKPNGSGIGLFIAQQIIHAHKGTIELNSKERSGTTITVKLPMKAAH